MRLISMCAILILAMFAIGCGGNSGETEATEEKAAVNEKAKPEKVELTVELYCKINDEDRALMMEYWPIFKDKPYEDIKPQLVEYMAKDDEILVKYGIEDPLDMGNFFRYNFAEIEEYNKTNPDYKEYADYNEAHMGIADLVYKRVTE